MFHEGVEHRISAQIGSSDIIIIYYRSGVDVEFLEQICDPIEFCSGSGDITVFSFSYISCNCLLLFRTPTYWISAKTIYPNVDVLSSKLSAQSALVKA